MKTIITVLDPPSPRVLLVSGHRVGKTVETAALLDWYKRIGRVSLPRARFKPAKRPRKERQAHRARMRPRRPV